MMIELQPSTRWVQCEAWVELLRQHHTLRVTYSLFSERRHMTEQIFLKKTFHPQIRLSQMSLGCKNRNV